MKKVIIKKPMFDNFVYIRDKFLKGKQIEVVIPQGSAVVNCKEWKETGKRMEKVFKIPTRPMILYGNYVPINS